MQSKARDVGTYLKLKGKGISIGKGAIRFSKPEKIDLGIVQKMLKGTFISKNMICG